MGSAFAFVLLKIFCLSFMSFSAPKTSLRIAYSVYPPFVMEGAEPSAPRGVIVDYWEKEIAPLANLKIEWIGPLSYLRAKKMTLSGDADAIYLVPTSVADDEKFLYSKKVKFTTRQGVAVLKDEPLLTLEGLDLKGKNIGKFAGGHIPSFLKDSKASVVEIISDDPVVRGIKMLLERRIWGFYLVSSESAFFAMDELGLSGGIKILNVPNEKSMVVCTLGFSPKIDQSLLKRILFAAEKRDSNEVFRGLLKTAVQKAP